MHPVLTLLAVVGVGSVIGIGIHLWFEPFTSIIVVAAGAIAGLALARALGEDVVLGVGAGTAIAMVVLGARALISIGRTLAQPSSTDSPRVWFAR